MILQTELLEKYKIVDYGTLQAEKTLIGLLQPERITIQSDLMEFVDMELLDDSSLERLKGFLNAHLVIPLKWVSTPSDSKLPGKILFVSEGKYGKKFFTLLEKQEGAVRKSPDLIILVKSNVGDNDGNL